MNRTLGFRRHVALCLGAVPPAAAEPANLLGVFGNWSAYLLGLRFQPDLLCHCPSRAPRAPQPPSAAPKSYLMVSDWPSRKVKAEPQIVYGYQAKEGGAAALGVGGDKFTFFIRNNGKEGSAWLQQLSDNTPPDHARCRTACRRWPAAPPRRQKGTKTSDTYSLAGFNDAMAKVHAACRCE